MSKAFIKWYKTHDGSFAFKKASKAWTTQIISDVYTEAEMHNINTKTSTC